MDVNTKNWRIFFLVINLVMICLLLVKFMNLTYPKVGHDYSQVIPYFLDTTLHYRNNGLNIQWYTSSFGTGIPAFSNPNNNQFSIPAMFTLLMDPWQAVILSSILFVSLGFFAGFYFFYKILKLNWKTSILGTIFFSANGFMMERMVVGHIGVQVFPLLVVLIICFLDISIPILPAAVIFAIVISLAVHGAGYFVIIIFGLSMLMVFPILYIFNPALYSWRRLFYLAILGGTISLLISASKLSAIYAFMRFFPRLISDSHSGTIVSSLTGVFLQLLGTMNLVPLFWLARINPSLLQKFLISMGGISYQNQVYGYWEFDMSVSPLVFFIIIASSIKTLYRPRIYIEKLNKNNKWIAVLMLVFFTILGLELTIAKGLLYQLVRNLPLISSLHVNQRYAAAFIFPLALIAAISLNYWVEKWPKKLSIYLFLTLNIITLLPMAYYFSFCDDLQNRTYDITDSKTIFNSIQTGESLEISKINYSYDYTQTINYRTSNLNPYEPIFGYYLEYFHPETKPGSVWDISDGYYNMTNPTGFVFPEVNASRPFARISIEDKDKLIAFVNHYDPDWKIPFFQQVLDWVSTISFVLAGLILVIFSVRHYWKKQNFKNGME